MLKIFPGYGERRFFTANNRLKSAELVIYSSDVFDIPFGASGVLHREIHRMSLTFEDRFEFAEFSLPGDVVQEASAGSGMLAVRLIIKELYEGSRWDDSCIAEIQFVSGSGPGSGQGR